eukprot:3995244-Amphidinium_carterae.1
MTSPALSFSAQKRSGPTCMHRKRACDMPECNVLSYYVPTESNNGRRRELYDRGFCVPTYSSL